MKKSAVEWLQEQQKELLNQVKSGEFKIEDFEYYNALYIEQAKEMEKEEKVKFALKVYLEKRQTHGGDIMQIAEKLVNL